MSRVAYQLTPKAAFHFGRDGLQHHTSAETFPSDSLFSALMWAMARVYPDRVGAFLESQRESAEVMRVSSLFPMAGALPLFPKPRIKIEIDRNDDGEQKSGKDMKKIQYVSPQILARVLSRYSMKGWGVDDENGRALQKGAVWMAKDEQSLLPEPWDKLDAQKLKNESVWDIHLAPRVTVDRITSQSNVYQVGRTVYSAGCGLWFMADVPDGATESLLDELLDYLADLGIGGERSAGYGGFTFKKIDVPQVTVSSGARAMLLSRYSPTLDELERGVLGENSAYELVDVGGWANAIGVQGNKRQRVRMLEVGSVVSADAVRGQWVDVTPLHPQPHNIYRSGIALTIPAGGKA